MAETFEMKWTSFLDCLTKQKTTLAVSDLEAIRKALVTAKFDQVCQVAKKKRLNGYNLFMQQRMSDLKEVVTDSNVRMGKVSEEWHKLTDVEKEEWKTKAKDKVALIPVKVAVKVRKARKSQKLSGYQLFVRERMVLVKDKEPKGRMTEIGKMWKALPVEEQEKFTARAAAVAVVDA